MPEFRLYNTATRRVDPVVPAREDHLRMYACGPTVYSYAHIGNFRSFLTADLILRTARAIGWKTTYVTNVTDVGHLTEDDYADASGDDKMEKALRSKEGERFANIFDLARYYTDVLLEDWQKLNLLEPDVRPRATEHVTGQIEAIEKLVAAGHAYRTEKGVYFSVRSFPRYGALSGNQDEGTLEQAVRDVVVDSDKQDPRDFALWKIDDKHLMQWYSPFGRGFPGWHIECSVMAHQYLGSEIDLHLGGEDLIFPHHECEIAQSESLTGETFVRHWVHTRFLQVEGEKMSRSKGNFFTVRDLTEGKGIDPLALRLALISGKYREPYNFTIRNLKDSVRQVERFRDSWRRVSAAIEADEAGPDRIGERLEGIYQEALGAMLDDLNTPVAIASAIKGLKLIGGMEPLSGASARASRQFLADIDKLLGFIGTEAGTVPETTDAEDPLTAQVESLLEERQAARAAKDFARADAIRNEIDGLGVEVMDTPEGPKWKRKSVL